MSLYARTTPAVTALLLALCVLIGVAPRSSAQTPYYNSTSLGAVKDGQSDYLVNFASNETDGWEGFSPRNTNIGFTRDFSGSDGVTTFSASAAANYRGFWSTGTYAHGTVTNAYNSGHTGFDPPHGYVVLGGAGSWTKNRFETPEALSSATALFHWHVSGNSSANIGTANARLDFAVTQGATSYFDLYNSSVTPNLLTRYGPGTYDYNTGVALGVNLDFLFWSSAFWDVTASDLAALGSTHRDLYGDASFNNTFVLDSIQLFDPNGNEIEDWQLVDSVTGAALFNQNGRISSVPEPGSCALCVGALASAALFLAVRRRRTASKA